LKLLLALGAGLLLLSLPGFPQETGAAGPSSRDLPRAAALIVPQAPGGETQADLQRVLTAALGIELARAGLEVRIPEEELLAGLAGATLEQLLEEAANADFLLLERYTIEEPTIRMEVEVWRVKGGERIASASASRRFDLRLDEVVGPVVAELWAQMRPHLDEALRERRRLAAAPPDASAAEAPPAAPEPLPAREPAPGAGRRWEIGVGVGTFFPIAALDPLFGFGYRAELYLERRSLLASAVLAYGVYTGYAGLLPAEPDTASYFGSLIPAGLSLRLGTSDRSRLGMHARIQAGAVFNASPQDKVQQRLTRVLPQVKAGAGVDLALSPRLGLSLDLLCELLLYMYVPNGNLAVEPIMGVSVPALFFYMRL
jgi:hypothetical protein